MFWVSLPGLPGDTGPNYYDRGKQLTTVSLVEVARVAGTWKYFGSRKTGRARDLLGRHSLSPRVSCAHYVRPSACYAGYVEVALSSNFMVFPIISALSLGREIHTVVRKRSVQPHRLCVLRLSYRDGNEMS